MFKLLKKLLGMYKPGHEYWVYIEDIKIKPEFAASRIKPDKWMKKLSYFRKTGELESTILLNNDWELIDGYSSYLIAVEFGLGKVPVYFVNDKE